MMEDQESLRQEEGEEAEPDEGAYALGITDGLDRLRENMKERHGDHDAACERDCSRQLATETQRDEAAGESRDDRESGEWNREPAHLKPRSVRTSRRSRS